MKRCILAAFGIVAISPALALADISYDYLQLDVIVDGEVDNDDDIDYDGIGLEGSVLFMPYVFGFAEANSRELELEDFDAAFSTFSAGVGARHGFDLMGPPALDVYGTLSYESYELIGSARGWGVGGGLRWLPVPEFEVDLGVRYVDYGSLDAGENLDGDIDGMRYSLRGLFNMTPNSAILLDLRFADLEIENDDSMDLDEQEIRLGYRWYY